MTKREIVFAISGAIIVAAGFAGRTALLRMAQDERRAPVSWFPDYGDTSGRPPVVFGFDGDYWRVRKAIRIDVRHGVPHMRDVDGTPIADLSSYIDAEKKVTGAEWIVVTASREEKIGDVIAVIDVCRKSSVKGIVLNGYLDAFARR
ncbi:MAG TPA: hypothetical protein VHD32_11685 [Candidatus Didemnitutus sp.]|nr:hypothetical protein [Candidatus Didemnitutus sp.]